MVDIRIPDLCIDLSPDECWQLYVLLGDRAPFVRHRLKVIRSGGTGTISLSTSEERRQVLDALAAGDQGTDVLSTGLRSLQTALGTPEGSGRSAQGVPRRMVVRSVAPRAAAGRESPKRSRH